MAFLGNVGVPAGLAFFVLYRVDQSVRELTKAVTALNVALHQVVSGRLIREQPPRDM